MSLKDEGRKYPEKPPSNSTYGSTFRTVGMMPVRCRVIGNRTPRVYTSLEHRHNFTPFTIRCAVGPPC